MTCDLTSGRLRQECHVGRAGIKTLYFAKYNDYAALTGITESGGEITSLGTDLISIYQFDMESNVGNFEEVPTVSRENGTAFMTQTITLTLFYIKPADLATLNALKKGRWVVWALDFQDKIRFFGQTRGMIATGGSDVSGAGPGDKKGYDLVLQSASNNFAPFMADYTTTPFDNFANVTVVVIPESLGPELVTNGDFAVTTGWTAANCTLTSVAGRGVMDITGTSNASIKRTLNSPLTPGNNYRWRIDVMVPSTNVGLCDGIQLSIVTPGQTYHDYTEYTLQDVWEPFVFDFVAGSAVTDIYLYIQHTNGNKNTITIGDQAQIDNVSLKEIL